VHVLIVEDEKKMAELLKRGWEEENLSVSLAFDGRNALEMAQALEYDAIVLDLMLPGIDGLEVARRLRTNGNKTPILFLTARDTVPDVVKGLDIGADGYMTKPFSFEEFLARLRSVSRRGPIPRPPLLQVGDRGLDPATNETKRSGEEIPLNQRK
jgi:two-component system, OmpR family, response regulator